MASDHVDFKEFLCKSRLMSDYLINNGSILIRIQKECGSPVFVFEYDDTIDKNINSFEENRRKCLF